MGNNFLNIFGSWIVLDSNINQIDLSLMQQVTFNISSACAHGRNTNSVQAHKLVPNGLVTLSGSFLDRFDYGFSMRIIGPE